MFVNDQEQENRPKSDSKRLTVTAKTCRWAECLPAVWARWRSGRSCPVSWRGHGSRAGSPGHRTTPPPRAGTESPPPPPASAREGTRRGVIIGMYSSVQFSSCQDGIYLPPVSFPNVALDFLVSNGTFSSSQGRSFSASSLTTTLSSRRSMVWCPWLCPRR